jgi:hypothetical protein
MSLIFRPILGTILAVIFVMGPVRAFGGQWLLVSPDHDQSFAYGSEMSRQWVESPPGTLALTMVFTNDPHVDQVKPRQYLDFIFHFPQLHLDRKSQIFFYTAPDRRSIPVARINGGFLGFKAIDLLPLCRVEVKAHRGFLTVILLVQDHLIPDSD